MLLSFLGKDGLVHISQIAEERVNKVSDYLEEGQVVKVKCLDVDQRGRIKLSIKEAAAEVAQDAPEAVVEETAVVEESATEAPVVADADLTPNTTIEMNTEKESEKSE